MSFSPFFEIKRLLAVHTFNLFCGLHLQEMEMQFMSLAVDCVVEVVYIFSLNDAVKNPVQFNSCELFILLTGTFWEIHSLVW